MMTSDDASNVKGALQAFLADHREHLKDGAVTEWYTDNAGSFTSNDLDEFLAPSGGGLATRGPIEVTQRVLVITCSLAASGA